MTDHRREFTNKCAVRLAVLPFWPCRYFNSQFDDGRFLAAEDVKAKLCAAATLAARVLWVSAGGSKTRLSAISADCSQVDS